MKTPAKKKRKSQQLVWPAIETRKRPRPYFPPLDLEKLISEASKQGLAGIQLESWVVEKFREQTRKQASELLSMLEIDAANPNWRKAFFALAQRYHGLGCVSYKANGLGGKAQWQLSGDVVLLEQVMRLKAKGMKAREAVREIARRRELYSKLPYKGWARKDDPLTQREAALWQRLQRILRRVRQNPDALKQQLLGCSEDPTVGILLRLQQKPW